MKITCQSCQAKYTIADEKVVGKTVKIKCKKCGATIVVAGNETTGAMPAPQAVQPQAAPVAAAPPGDDDEGEGGATRVFVEGSGPGPAAGPGGVEWTVNVTDEDQRTMNAAQIVAEFQRGVVNGDTYVWKDGMADWLPISGVPELMSMVSMVAPRPAAGAPAAAPAPAAAAPAPMNPMDLPEPSGGLGGTMIMMDPPSPMAAASPAAAAGAPAAARRKAPTGGVDLFAPGAQEAAPAAAAASTATTSHDRLVGERNENSVLFSISALTASAAASKQGADALLDLAAPSPAARNGGRGGAVDDIMNLGGGIAAAPVLAPPPLLAPVVEAPPPPPQPVPVVAAAAMPDYPKKSNTPLILGGIAIVALMAGVGSFLALSGGSKTGTDATNAALSAAAPSSTPSAAPATTTTQAPAAQSAVAAADSATPAASGTPSDQKSAQAVAAGDKGKPGTAADAKKPDAKADPKADAKKPDEKKPDEKKPDEKKDTGGGGGGKEFDRAAALASLGGAAGGARACKKPDGPTGSGKVKVTFAPSGAVTSVTLESGPFQGTPLAGCIIGAFRGARVPAFDGSPVSVSKSFSIN